MLPSDAASSAPAADPFLRGRRVVLFTWRDTGNPEGGGAERYLEQVAQGLRDRGARVTVFTAAYPGAAPRETIDGIRYVRSGGKLSVYARGVGLLLRRAFGRVDAVVDVQNGLPFFTPLVFRGPTIVLVHHVHREQWPVVYPGVTGRVGWWIESRLAPRLYRRARYVVVSEATRDEVAALGVRPERMTVVRNGSDPVVQLDRRKTSHPSFCVVGRLVPHKQVEHAIDAAVALRAELPGLRLRIVGSGWWESALREYAEQVGAGDSVVFEGQVSEVRKQEIYEESWVMALPSIKEGWGLVVGEAAAHHTPTVAYAAAGGTRESVADGVSGLLVEDHAAFVAALRRLLSDPDLLHRLAEGAAEHSSGFSWEHTRRQFADVVASVVAAR